VDTGVYAVVSGSAAAMARMDVIANNVANSHTTGFKGDEPVFTLNDFSPPQFAGEPRDAVIGQRAILQPLLVEVAGVETDFSQGALRETGNPLDVAIQGPGFFVVGGRDGFAYTRRGDFALNADGELVTNTGALVIGKSGPISLGAGKVVIDEEGNVSLDGQHVDTLRIVDFPGPGRLVKSDGTMFRSVQAGDEGTKVDAPRVHQGFLEESNVSVVQELVNMIETSRAYEAYQRVVSSFLGERGIFSRAVNDVGRV